MLGGEPTQGGQDPLFPPVGLVRTWGNGKFPLLMGMRPDKGHAHCYPAMPFLRFIPQQYLNKWTELMQNVYSTNTIANGSIKQPT